MNSYAQSPEEYWQGNSYDAALWAPDSDTQGFLSITNTTQEPRTVRATFYVNGHSEEQEAMTIPARRTRTLPIDDLVARSRQNGAGIHIDYSEYPGDVLVEGHLLNKRTGFEKYIHFLDKTLPGTDTTSFLNNTVRTGLNSRYNQITTDSGGDPLHPREPFAVNENEAGTLLGNINYAPYTQCP